MTRNILLTLCLFVIAVPAITTATTVRTGDTFTLPAGQQVEDNFLGVGNPVQIAGQANQDVTVIGDRVFVSGEVLGDLLALGVHTDVTGVVAGDVRVVAGTVTVSGTISGDLLVSGFDVRIESGAAIGGDVVLYGQSAVIDGTVEGNIIGSVRELSIDAPVGGGIDVSTHQLVLGNMASVTESVRYASDNLLIKEPGTVIAGAELRNDPVPLIEDTTLQSAVWPMVSVIFGTFVWLLLSKQTLSIVVAKTVKNAPRSAMTGIITLLTVPIVSIFLFISMVGGYLAIVLLLGYALLLFVSAIALPAVVGYMCMQVGSLKIPYLSPVSILAGAIVTLILWLLPVVGIIVLILLIVFVFGGLIEAVVRTSQ